MSRAAERKRLLPVWTASTLRRKLTKLKELYLNDLIDIEGIQERL